MSLPNCPKCNSEYVYEDGNLLVCPECAYEFSADDLIKQEVVVVDGDTVSVIKDLKIKGTSSAVKVGTKVKNIRLCDGDHNIDCKIPGHGAMKLKSEFVKKA